MKGSVALDSLLVFPNLTTTLSHVCIAHRCLKCMLSLVKIYHDTSFKFFSVKKVLNLSESSIIKVTKKHIIQIILFLHHLLLAPQYSTDWPISQCRGCQGPGNSLRRIMCQCKKRIEPWQLVCKGWAVFGLPAIWPTCPPDAGAAGAKEHFIFWSFPSLWRAQFLVLSCLSSGFPRLQLILMCAKSLWLPKKQCPVRCAEGKSQGQLLRSESPQRMFGPRLNGRIHASIAILRLRTGGQSGSKSCSLKVSALDLPKTQRGRWRKS